VLIKVVALQIKTVGSRVVEEGYIGSWSWMQMLVVRFMVNGP